MNELHVQYLLARSAPNIVAGSLIRKTLIVAVGAYAKPQNFQTVRVARPCQAVMTLRICCCVYNRRRWEEQNLNVLESDRRT